MTHVKAWTPQPTTERTKAIRLNNTGPIQPMREPSWLERLLSKRF